MIDRNRLAVCSWSLQPESCADLIEKVRATGLTRVQLHLNPIATGEAGWVDAASDLAAADIAVVSGMLTCVGEDYSSIAAIERTGGIVPDATWRETRAQAAAAVPIARDLGLRLVTLHAGFIPHEPANPLRKTVMHRLAEVADLYAAIGCAIALETGQESAAALLSLLDELGRNDVGVNFDPANMLLYGSGDPIAALQQLAPRVRQAHLKDAVASHQPGIEWGQEVPVGEGQVDWPAFFTALQTAGFDGDCCVEREAGDQRIEDVRTAAEFVTR